MRGWRLRTTRAGGACGRRAMRRMCSSSKPGQVEGVRGTRNGRGGCRGVLVRCPVGSYAAGGYCRQTSQRGGHGKSPPALLVLANYVRGARRARARVVTSTWRDEDGRERCGDGFTAWLKSHLKRPRKGLMGRSYPTRSKVTRKGARQRPFRECLLHSTHSGVVPLEFEASVRPPFYQSRRRCWLLPGVAAALAGSRRARQRSLCLLRGAD